MKGGNVIIGDQAAVGLRVRSHFLRHRSAVEVVPNGVDLFDAVAARSFFRRRHGAEGAREIRLAENLAGNGKFAIGEE